jgi:hypothetical protein
MARGLWVPGSVWEFRRNVRSLPTTGVQVVQSSTEPTTWQWEYTIQEDDLPLVDTVGRGDVLPDMLYGCLVNLWFRNNSGAAQTYSCRAEVESRTLGTFQSSVVTRSNVANNNYVYFAPRIHSVGVGTTLRVRLWGTATHDLAGIRLVLVPMVTPPVSDVLLLAETISAVSQSGVNTNLGVYGTINWNLSAYSVNDSTAISSVNSGYSLLLLSLNSAFVGGMISWLGDNTAGSARSISILATYTTTLHANGGYGVYDIAIRLLDVRFGHLFRNLAGVAKF